MRVSLRARMAQAAAVAGLIAALVLPGAAPATAQENVVLRVGTTQDLNSLNPYETILVVGYEVFGLTYNYLVDWAPTSNRSPASPTRGSGPRTASHGPSTSATA